MKTCLSLLLAAILTLALCRSAFAQAFGDYGRTLGGIPHGGITGPRAPGGVTQGGGGNSGVGEIGGRRLPAKLVDASKTAGLYPRQDDEAEMVDQLSEGEPLVPMVQSSGGNDWFMVKTQKGVVGWIKSTDVRE
ncbi:MAG: SH3 domain-containing protein [Deltaproteobacteria bacterium]|nr:SH3 domain-containing protein [Deltaproteobacteria bacterium]